jgi:glycosyltransferase involved in cell wall biosynthesis
MPLNDQPIFVSMVVATLGRSAELEVLMASLAALARRDFEVIVVDQNADDRLVPILERWKDAFPIRHLRPKIKGLSRARNLGAAEATGEWLLFPDDDCWYARDFLDRFAALVSARPADFYCGRAVNAKGETIMVRFAAAPQAVGRDNVWHTLIEWVFFVRREAFFRTRGFDESLGVGANTPWGAYEGPDLVLNLLSARASGVYEPSLTGFHPDERQRPPTPEANRKMRVYGAGLGYVMRKHGYGFTTFLPHLLRPIAGMVIYTLTGRPGLAGRSRQILAGRWSGWRSTPETTLS